MGKKSGVNMEAKNVFIALLLFVCFFSANCLGAIINVGPGTSFNPTGSNDQNVINTAIQSANSGDTVQLASITFHISSPIIMKSGVTLNGNAIGATVIDCDKPSSNFATQNIINCKDVSNIVISNFLIDGGWGYLSTMHAASNSYRDHERGVYLSNCSNAIIHDLKMQYCMGDFIYCTSSTSNVQVYNTVCKPGHDSFDAWSAGNGISIYNNCWGTFENSCVKIHNTKNVQIFKNTFYTDTGSGNAGVEVMGDNETGLNIYNNIFSTLQLNTIYHDSADGACSGRGTVSNNIYYNSPTYNGISGMNITSTGNIVTSSYSSSKGTKNYGYVTDNGTINLPVYKGSLAPSIIFPTNGSSISTVNGYVSISWTYLNATCYSINVYNSTSQFDSSHLIYSLITSQTSASVPISYNGSFAIKIGAYDEVHNSWVYNSPASFFTISGKTASTVYSGIFGYLTDTTTGQPIQGAVLKLSNNTWNNTEITDAVGFYQFTVNSGNSACCLSAFATDYLNSPKLPIKMTGTNTELNLKMVEVPNYFVPHYVQLYVSTNSNDKVSGCEVQIYAPNNDPSNEKPNFDGWTNDDGRVGFHLTQDVTYKIVTITLGGQTYTNTLTPNLDHYTLTIPASSTFATPASKSVYMNYFLILILIIIGFISIRKSFPLGALVICALFWTFHFTGLLDPIYEQIGIGTGIYSYALPISVTILAIIVYLAQTGVFKMLKHK
jgi:hypothetical protein